jgi:hypothetical protein
MAKIRFCTVCGFTRMLFFVVVLGTFGCSSATYIQAKVADNPLDRIEQKAQEDWTVKRTSANSLQLSDAWPFHSVAAFGYSASHANLVYDDTASMLDVQYYLQTNQLFTLFLPITLDAEPGAWGAALKPTMNDQITDILRWGNASIVSRRGGNTSEPFPSKTSPPSSK